MHWLPSLWGGPGVWTRKTGALGRAWRNLRSGSDGMEVLKMMVAGVDWGDLRAGRRWYGRDMRLNSATGFGLVAMDIFEGL